MRSSSNCAAEPGVTAAGWVDDLTSDGTIIWICLAAGVGRVMIHRGDGFDIWRVDSRILQDRRFNQPEPHRT